MYCDDCQKTAPWTGCMSMLFDGSFCNMEIVWGGLDGFELFPAVWTWFETVWNGLRPSRLLCRVELSLMFSDSVCQPAIDTWAVFVCHFNELHRNMRWTFLNSIRRIYQRSMQPTIVSEGKKTMQQTMVSKNENFIAGTNSMGKRCPNVRKHLPIPYPLIPIGKDIDVRCEHKMCQ